MILDKIEKLLQEVSNLTAQNADEIEQLRLKYLSKKGEIAALMADFRNVSADQKKAVGMKINELKNMAIARINELKENTAAADDNADDIIVATWSDAEKGIVYKYEMEDSPNELKINEKEYATKNYPWKTNLKVVKVEYRNCSD